jgi:acetyltransferase-like isoleucine patch superfamily enzyme
MSYPDSARVLPNVRLGEDVTIGEFVIIGQPPRGHGPGDLPTVIGDGATIRSHTVIYAGNRIGDGFATGHGVAVREENSIGDNVSIGTHSVIEHHVKIGNGVRIHSCVFVPEYTLLEDGVWLGPNVVLTNTLHPLCPHAKECMKGPRIRAGAKICASACILPDIEIGEMALVGAGAVVTEDVAPRAVVVGMPVKVKKMIDQLTCRYGLCSKPYPGDEDES